MTDHHKLYLNQGAGPPEFLTKLNARLEQLLPDKGAHDRVSAAMRAGTLGPGKRIRPLLMILLACDMGKEKDYPGLIDLACSVEMIHASSLMLDDLPCMDNAFTRRGMPTIHRQYGEAVTLLAVVALLSNAFGTIASAHGLSPTCRSLALSELSSAVGVEGLVNGQQRDLSADRQLGSFDAVIRTNHLKTSRLFDAALHMAALVTEVSPAVILTLRSIAEELGQAFQLLDDLADSHAWTGKDINQDRKKSTLVTLFGKDDVYRRLREHLRRADARLAEICFQGQTRSFINHLFSQQLASICGCLFGKT